MDADAPSVPQWSQNYRACMIAAPMVRISTLAFRLFAARHGADVVFSEELVAIKLAKCVREEVTFPGPLGRGVEFVQYEDYKKEKRRVVVAQTLLKRSDYELVESVPSIIQFGVADPDIAFKCASLVCEDFDGIDVNMGCPKKFSVDQGMGAALMTQKEKAASILSAINRAVNSEERIAARKTKRRIPISFKTRLFDTVEESLEQIGHILTACGEGTIHSVTLHCRTRPQRSETMPNPVRGQQVVAALRMRFPNVVFVYNGSLRSRAEGVAFLETQKALHGSKGAGCFEGVMIARGMMWNPTCLAKQNLIGDGKNHASGDKEKERKASTTEPVTVMSEAQRIMAMAPGEGPDMILASISVHSNGGGKEAALIDAAAGAIAPGVHPESIAGGEPDITVAAPLAIGFDQPVATQVCALFASLLHLHVVCDTNYAFVKYHLTRTFPEYKSCKPLHSSINQSKSLRECLVTLRKHAGLCPIAADDTTDVVVQEEEKQQEAEGRKRSRE